MAKQGFVSFGILILIVALAAGAMAVASTTGFAAKGSKSGGCTDTDGGQLFVKGTCTGKDPYTRPSRTGSWTDNCYSSSTIEEWYCGATTNFCYPTYVTMTGYSCVDGVLVKACTPTTEICGDGIDQDCNGADLACSTKTYYRDYDTDSYGSTTIFITSTSATPPVGYVSISGDCNDNSAVSYPGATEICDELDNNCDGVVNEGVAKQTYYKDADGDGYGGVLSQVSCAQPLGYSVTVGGDCNDYNINIKPGATEVCGDSIDQDCDGYDCTTPITVSCFDADGGANYAAAGTCTGSTGTKTDYCSLKNTLVEFVCTAPDGWCAATTHTESNGMCNNGAWVLSTCIDSDGSGGFYTKGTCTDAGGTYTDYCDSSGNAVDYYCVSSTSYCWQSYSKTSTTTCSDGILVAV